MLLGLFTALEATGGIQRASRHMAAVLADFARNKGWPCRLLSLNDAAGEHDGEVAGMRFRYRGYGRSKYRFVVAALDAVLGRPGLVFANHPNLAPVTQLVQMLTGTCVVVVGWGVDVWEPLAWHRRHALRRADALLAISTYTADRLVQVQSAHRSRVHLLPLALEPTFWEVTQQAQLHSRPDAFPSGRVVLTVTRLAAVDAYKGVDTLIQAMPRLTRAVPDAHLVVVGDGDDRPRLQALAHAEGVSRRVHFLGALERNDLAACYQHCDIFALPSKGEGFGLVFVEAMAFGKPVVGGAHGGTLDVIEHGKSGFLVPHGDVDQLAATLTRLLTDPALCAEIGRRARERVEQQYLFPQFEARLTKILEELMSR